jgi:glutamyl-tRNA reductase
MVAQAVADYMAWLRQRRVLPVLVGMRRKANDLAQNELELALRKLPTDDPAVAEHMSRLAHRLVNKLLHEPTIRLKARAAQGDAEPYARALQDLFSLEDYLS